MYLSSESIRLVKEERFPKDEWMEPLNLLEERFRHAKDESSPRDGGMHPKQSCPLKRL